MASSNFVSVEMLESKLSKYVRQIERSNLPVGLHAWPKCGKQGFCGIGLIDWGGGTDPQPFGDVFVGIESELYSEINQKLQQACDRLGVRFMSMA